MKYFILTTIFIIFFFIFCNCNALYAKTQTVCQLPEEPQVPQKEENEIDYKEYLKDPKKLGFSPNLKLFKSAYMLLKSKHIENADDSVLLTGCKKEVNKLLKTAGLRQTFNPQSLSEVETAIEQNASSKVNRDLLWFAAIEGMLSSLNDPHTVLLTPQEYKSLMEQMQATHFGGIGIFIEKDKSSGNKLIIFEPIEGTPAYRAGLLPEDHIVSINGEPTKEMPIELAMVKMRGEIGTYVTLLINRKNESAPLTFKIKREKIKIQAISCKLIDQKYGYIRVRTFGDNTGAEFAKAVNALLSKNIEGIIIDLRNNGGGLIDAAIDICSQLITSGNTIVSVEDRTGSRSYMRSSGNVSLPKMPIVVLINKYSASASEITAGALSDYGLAKLIGEKSYGKGSVQEVLPLSNGGAFKITVAHYFTPKNRNINKVGITPDIKYDMEVRLAGKKIGDTQLKRAVDFLKTGK